MKRFINTYLVPPVAFVFIYLVSLTLKIIEVDREKYEKLSAGGGPHIYPFWHGRLFLYPFLFRRMRDRIKVLVSPSADGEVIARTLSWFGFGIIRGSSFKKSVSALREMKKEVDAGYSIVMIADGSRGPAEKLQMGTLALAKLTGRPAYPSAISFSRCWRMKSWDRMMIPKPFARAVIVYGDPVWAPENCGAQQLEDKRLELERSLHSLTMRADGCFREP